MDLNDLLTGEQPNPEEKLETMKEVLLHNCWEFVHTLYNHKDLDKMLTLAEILRYVALGMQKEDEVFNQDWKDLLN
tara:strand:+ start:467 stop:694 length:228 start_codon:yes stop_codon:yes gene_type:complete